jgi:ABC-2 type transport system permease protein
MAMAGTDFYHQVDFESAAEKHRRRIERTMSDHLIGHAGDLDYNYRAGEELWRQVPPLAYRLPSWDRALARNGQSLMILAAGLALSIILALGAVRRSRWT